MNPTSPARATPCAIQDSAGRGGIAADRVQERSTAIREEKAMTRLARLALNEEGFVFDPATGDSFMVNRTGLLILAGLRDGRDVATVTRALLEAYEVDVEYRTTRTPSRPCSS